MPAGAPQNVSVSPINSTALLISWQPPSTELQNGVIREYRINVTESETRLISYLSVGTIMQTTVSNLHPYYSYQVSIAAVTVGIGLYSTEIAVQLPEAGKTLCPVLYFKYLAFMA